MLDSAKGMVGSGIASASRKPAGPRGSWLKQGPAGYLSPRICARRIHNARPQMPINVCNPAREERQMPVNNAGRLWHFTMGRPP